MLRIAGYKPAALLNQHPPSQRLIETFHPLDKLSLSCTSSLGALSFCFHLRFNGAQHRVSSPVVMISVVVISACRTYRREPIAELLNCSSIESERDGLSSSGGVQMPVVTAHDSISQSECQLSSSSCRHDWVADSDLHYRCTGAQHSGTVGRHCSWGDHFDHRRLFRTIAVE